MHATLIGPPIVGYLLPAGRWYHANFAFIRFQTSPLSGHATSCLIHPTCDDMDRPYQPPQFLHSAIEITKETAKPGQRYTLRRILDPWHGRLVLKITACRHSSVCRFANDRQVATLVVVASVAELSEWYL